VALRGEGSPRSDEEAELTGLASGRFSAFSATRSPLGSVLVNRLRLGPFLLTTSGAVVRPFGRAARMAAGSFNLSRSIIRSVRSSQGMGEVVIKRWGEA
jgi:hypothetical protein